MTGQNGELEPRVSALEADMTQLREGVDHAGDAAAAARVLAAGADRDVSEVRGELRAHRSALNALREVQVETLLYVRELQGDVRRLEGEMRQGFARVEAGMAGIVTILSRIAPEN